MRRFWKALIAHLPLLVIFERHDTFGPEHQPAMAALTCPEPADDGEREAAREALTAEAPPGMSGPNVINATPGTWVWSGVPVTLWQPSGYAQGTPLALLDAAG